MLLSGPALDLGPNRCNGRGTSQLRVEGICDAGVDRAHLLPSDAGNDVLLCLAAVVDACLGPELRIGEVLFERLLHCCIRTRVALGTYRDDELRLHPLDLPLLVRAGWDGLA